MGTPRCSICISSGALYTGQIWNLSGVSLLVQLRVYCGFCTGHVLFLPGVSALVTLCICGYSVCFSGCRLVIGLCVWSGFRSAWGLCWLGWVSA